MEQREGRADIHHQGPVLYMHHLDDTSGNWRLTGDGAGLVSSLYHVICQ